MQLRQRRLFIGIVAALTIMFSVVGIATLAGNLSSAAPNLLENGGFEQGFVARQGCGMVGAGWDCFSSGGRASYSFADETWEAAVAEGDHAQLISIHTKRQAGDENRTSGIAQTINVAPGETYTLNLRAMIRSEDWHLDEDPWRYVLLVGWAHEKDANWADAVFTEVNAGATQARYNPAGYHDIRLTVVPRTDWLTLFVGGRMKWGTPNREALFDIDAVSLTGAQPAAPVRPKQVQAPAEPADDLKLISAATTGQVCDGDNLLTNGDFEHGFDADGAARQWQAFNTGSAADFGYQAETWAPAVANGAVAQRLTLQTRPVTALNGNEVVGIYQTVSGLRRGASYQLNLSALVREDADYSNEDPYRYSLSWGYSLAAEPVHATADLDEHHDLPLAGISLYGSPDAYTNYTQQFTAPGESINLYLLGLNKWPLPDRRIDFNFDDVELRQCRTVTQIEIAAVPQNLYETTEQGQCDYIVRPGDSLSAIAMTYDTTIAHLQELNALENPRLLRVSQLLKIPCSAAATSGGASTNTPAPAPTNTPLPTDTPTPEPTNTPLPTDTPEPEPTDTPLPTNTPTSAPTNTPLPTNTPEPEPTDTPLPTDTPEPEPTDTPLPTDTPTSEPAPEIAEQVTVSGQTANIRTGPGTMFGILTTTRQNAQFDVQGANEEKTWWQICCVEGQTAWISDTVVEFVGDPEAVAVISPFIPANLSAEWEIRWTCRSPGCPQETCMGRSIAAALEPLDARWLILDREATWEDNCGETETWRTQIDVYSGKQKPNTADSPLFEIWAGINPGEANSALELEDRSIPLWCTEERTLEQQGEDDWTFVFSGRACYDAATGIMMSMEYRKDWLFSGVYDGQTYERKSFGDYEIYQQILTDTNLIPDDSEE